MLSVCDLNTVDSNLLNQFFKKCQELEYVNNVSLTAIRSQFVFQREGNIWFLVKDNEIIGMAGCHRFDEVDPKSFRIQYRGCELPGKDVKQGLSRSHFNSSTFRELIPYELAWIESKGYDKNNVYLSANLDNRNHRAMELIERQGFLNKHQEGLLFGVPQTIWRFNTKHYEQVREKVTSYVV